MRFETAKAKFEKEVVFCEYSIDDAGEVWGFIRVRKSDRMPEEIHLRLGQDDVQEETV